MRSSNLPKTVDLVVVGGGVTGAGVLREAARAGLAALLAEQRDFAWGTSSRSSKLVHGGLRYLKEGRVFLTKASVEERCRLLAEAPGLVEKLGFVWPVYEGVSPGKFMLGMGLFLYDIMARERQHRYLGKQAFSLMVPNVRQEGLKGGFVFQDAQVDDARLVLRLVLDAVAAGAFALNYTRAAKVERDSSGNVRAVVLEDVETGETRTVETRAVVNATGVWAETLHRSPNPALHLRPLRGSHLVFSAQTLPVCQAVSFINPADHRPVFAIPWEGATLIGTTDADYKEDLMREPGITAQEFSLLLSGARHIFPGLGLSEKDVLATFAGVRPVLSAGKKDPSKESREHVVWVDKGLVTITGGKLTTFRRLAWDALKAARPFIPKTLRDVRALPVVEPLPPVPADTRGLSPDTWRRLLGRYGRAILPAVAKAAPEDLEFVPGTHTLFAELPYMAGERVRHLDDLLLRRARLGILCPGGGSQNLDRVEALCAPVLGWDAARWAEERKRYLNLWAQAYAPRPSAGGDGA
jgi:glycerol-3-phosphate dehydrogenase